MGAGATGLPSHNNKRSNGIERLNMATLDCESRFGADVVNPECNWQTLNNTFECRVLLCPEVGGGYSAHAMRLPGVVSEGETEAKALDNIADAFQAAIQTYREAGESIP